jgi:Cd2+/Zn2+-exporting ATPase
VSAECCGAPVQAGRAAVTSPAPRSRRDVWLIAAGGFLVLLGMAAGMSGLSVWSGAACLSAIAVNGVLPARRALRSIRKRALDINALMVIAVLGAVALGEFVEAASVLWLFGIAELLESRSLHRAREAIRSLLTDAPTSARVWRDGAEVVVPVEAVRIGDLVLVRPGDRIPVDGTVSAGVSAVNQAPITGESRPVEKTIDEGVFAGTINGTGALEIVATREASDSTIARIIHLVEQAQARRAPIQTFVDRFARRYTPAVTLLALVVAVTPPLAFGGAWDVWTYRALALLVVACPCALVISTPVAMVSALTAAARSGVLIKGGAYLERLGAVRCVAFDKTGTLTSGDVTVTDVHAVDGASADGVLSVAAALEARSEHPIGRAIVHQARGAGLAVASSVSFRALPGLGAEATVGEGLAVVGSHRLFEERQLCSPSLHARVTDLVDRGATPVLVGHNGAALGVIALRDELRDGGRDVVTALRAEGVEHVALLTGDTRVNGDLAGEAAGLDEVHAELLPDDKVRVVGELRARHGPVAMVGDGINDAPALASADVGVVMGVAGTGVAIETADVALMADELERLPFALRLGRATVRNVRSNIALALGLKLAFVALAAAGVATLWMAIVADTGASLIVTANSLRLLRVR